MTGQKIYLAARYSRWPEMQGIRDVLEALGFLVTSRWIDLHDGRLEESISSEELRANPGCGAGFAAGDISDIRRADIVVSFTELDGGGKGGRHVEFGLALGLGKRLFIVGPREHIFHSLPEMEWYPDWSDFVRNWAAKEAKS